MRDSLPGPLSAALRDPGASFERRLAKALAKRVDVTYRITAGEGPVRELCLRRASDDTKKGRARWRVEESNRLLFPVSLFSRFEEDSPVCGTLNNGHLLDGKHTRIIMPALVGTPETNGANAETGKDSEDRFCWMCGEPMGAEDGCQHRGCEMEADGSALLNGP